MQITFTGEYKKLIPMGYKFQKVWANNYICYHKEDIAIWKAGKDVEIMDLYNKSYLVLQYLIANNFNIKDEHSRIVINKINDTVEDFNFDKHTDIALYLQGKSDSELEILRETYKTIMITQENIDCLKELYDLKLIEIKGDK